MSVLSLRGWTVLDGPFEVVHEVDCDVATGETVALVGPNGSGKAALLRGVAGILPSRGSIRVDGVDMTALPVHARVRRGVVYCPSERALFPDMSVRENLLTGAFLRRDKEVESDLGHLHERLPRLAQRWRVAAGQLSGGEQRLLAVAKALMARPKLLLLHEPTAGLAPDLLAAVEKLLATGLDKTPPGVLVVDQELEWTMTAASRFLAFRHGRIAAELTRTTEETTLELRQQLETYQ